MVTGGVYVPVVSGDEPPGDAQASWVADDRAAPYTRPMTPNRMPSSARSSPCSCWVRPGLMRGDDSWMPFMGYVVVLVVVD